MSGSVALTLFILGLIVAIMLHEWGHFATARRFGMRAERFFLGFGPTLWSTRVGETEYGVKAIPAGGFVRIAGMLPSDQRQAPVAEAVFDAEAVADDRRIAAGGGEVTDQPAVPPATWQHLEEELRRRGAPRHLRQDLITRTRAAAGSEATPAEAARAFVAVAETTLPEDPHPRSLTHRILHGDEGRFYQDRPGWQRAIVLSAGSAMHFVQAFLLLFVAYLAFGDVAPTPVVEGVEAGTPAAVAGLQPGDRILAVGGRPVEDFADARRLLRARPGQQVTLRVARDGQEVTLTPTLAERRDEETGQVYGFLGFSPQVEVRGLAPLEAGRRTLVGQGSLVDLTYRSAVAFGRVFGPEGLAAIFTQVTGEADRDMTGAVSPIGAAQAAAEGGEQFGAFFVLLLLASVNIFVGLFNMLPLPPLDGGHLAVLGVEVGVNTVRGWRGQARDFAVDHRTVAAIAVPVLVFIGTISLALMWLDVTNPVQLP